MVCLIAYLCAVDPSVLFGGCCLITCYCYCVVCSLRQGGVTTASACVASSGFKGVGDAENALSPKVDCIITLDIEVHNCQDFTLWMLPKVTTQMLAG